MEGLGVRHSFWKNKKVFVTGHTGFKGSWLCLWLQKMGADVCGFSLPPESQPNLYEITSVADDMMSLYGDIRDYDAMNNAIQNFSPEIVFHLAAQPIVRKSFKQPLQTLETNIMGTAILLEAARKSDSIQVVVNVTSDKCYYNNEWVWGYRENDPMGGSEPYSVSKGCAELITTAYRKSFFSSPSAPLVATARAGNVIGGGDWGEDRLIPDIVRSFLKKEPVLIRNPHAIRPWQHVLDPLNGYLLLAENLWGGNTSFAEAWNFGPYDEDAWTVSQVTNLVAKLWGEGASWKLDQKDHPPESNYLKLDCSKVRSVLSWKPHLRLIEGLPWTIEWYHNYSRNINMLDFSLEQINLYEEKMRN